MTSNGYTPEDYRRDIEDIRDSFGDLWELENLVEDLGEKIANLEEQQEHIVNKLSEVITATNKNSDRLQGITNALLEILKEIKPQQPEPPPSAPIPFPRKPKRKPDDRPTTGGAA